MIEIVVLISGNGSNLQAIIDKCHGKTVDITAVISDQSDAYGLQRAIAAEIPTIVLEQDPDESRDDFCDDLDSIVNFMNPQLIVLAGFMKILTPNFVAKYENQILNIHPSLLPKYQGLNTHQRVLAANDPKHGITIHLVTEELDAGPILLQKRIVRHQDDTVEEIEERIHRLEHEWYPEVISLLARWQTIIKGS